MTDNPRSTDAPARHSAAACPICGRPPEPRYRPFCSRRCADVDLNRWLGGVYRVGINDPEAEIEDLPPEEK